MELKLILTLTFIGLSTAGKLSNNYLPPHSAATAGGYSGFLQSPNRPSSLYIPPSQGSAAASAKQQSPHYHGANSAFAGKSPHRPAVHSANSYSPAFRQQQAEPIAILRSENVNNGDGSYNFAFETANGIRRQEDGHLRNPNSAHPEQVVKGSYSYTGDDGKLYTVHYTADSGGFQVQGDHLPTPPPIPYEIKQSLALHHHKTAQLNQQHSASPSASSSSSSSGFASSRGGLSSQYLPPQQQHQQQQGYSYSQPGGRKYK
ncbi:pupal cuticle protein 20-like [Episyrphus balteatus]|uniref:pupal cuticle protein 20-like n=1 Tax=Episyrphus balteatus TaxID=286459 RepID=UPI002486AADA|nr:pupal cuticle protein 20-like [Episyrphus balteatus]